MKKYLFLVLSCLMAFALCGAAAATEPLTDNNDVNLAVSNDARFDLNADDTYNFFNPTQSSTQGINSLWINSNNVTTGAEVINTTNQTGTFYIGETGNRGWQDDGILMLAVNGTIPDNFAVTITASGYQWIPVTANTFPSVGSLTYVPVSISETFTKEDFLYYSYWRPMNGNPNPYYPIYAGQIMSDTSNTFQIMFIDLYAGVLNPAKYPGVTLIDNGKIKVNYSFQNLQSFAAFNIYGFCQNSNQGTGIRFTNTVNTPSITGSSGYYVTGLPELTAKIMLPAETYTGTTYPVSVEVSNIGGSNAGPFYVKIYEDGRYIGTQIIESLDAKETTIFTFDWKPKGRGTHNITIIVDTENAVLESNEQNNQVVATTNTLPRGFQNRPF